MSSFKEHVALLCIWMLLVPFPEFAQEPQKTDSSPVPAPSPSTTSAPAAAPITPTPSPTGKIAAKYTPDGKPILEEGTPVRLRLTRTLSSADALAGDRVDFEVLDPIKVGDVEVVPQGGIAWGTITEAQAKRRMARGGKLNVNIDSVKLSNGDKAALRAVKETKGGGHTGAMTGAMVATGIVFFPAAPLFLFMKGKDIVIPKGTEITAYVNADTIFTAQSGPAPSPTSTAIASTADIEISSTPDGADIEVDGMFRGNSPSSISLPPGDHTVVIRKPGFQNWQRAVHLTTGNVKLKAELQPTN